MFNFFKKKIVVRIAPSPTGVLHIGTARTALFNYLFAKQNNGEFILRIEDTDTERSTKEFEKNIIDSLTWLGISYDKFYRQSERKDVYKKYLKKLIDSGFAYISNESDGDRKEVIRFKNPNRVVEFDDIVRGKIKFDTTDLGDFVIAKSLDEPLYHLAVVVDDHEMKVTHIIRGEDMISNTPRHILLQEAIGAMTPKYAHLPLLLGADKSKLSKRHGAASITEYKNQGYLKEAIINHLSLLGWNPGNDREVFSIKELISEFKINEISKGGAIFNQEKLDWFNREYLKKLPLEKVYIEIENRLQIFNPNRDLIKRITPVIIERISKFNDINNLLETGELDYYFKKPVYDTEKIIWKKSDASTTLLNLTEVKKLIGSLDQSPTSEVAREKIWSFAEEKGRGDVLWPLRYSLSGKEKSTDPFTLISILGREESLSRIEFAINKLNDK